MSTAAEFFDQFTDVPEAPEGSPWCPRHWAPCPLVGCNGIAASLELARIFAAELMPAWASSPGARKRELAKQSPLCCKLGDERMYDLWGHWPPSTPTEED
jgi:hypothetical protein